MDRAQLPKFGNWESEEIPYTMYFDNARKGMKNNQIYQYGLQDNIEAELKDPELKDPKASEAKMQDHDKLEIEALNASKVVKPKHDRSSNREADEMRRLTDSPLHHKTGGRRNSSNSPHHRYGGSSAGDTPKRVARQSVGSDRSTDQSPLHPHSQARGAGKNIGVSSPSWERKATSDGSHGLAPSTPGRSRLRSVTRGDDSPDRSPAVPKFGDWDETDPSAAEGYTQVFDRVREEKHSETGKVPITPTETSHSSAQKQSADDNAKNADANVKVNCKFEVSPLKNSTVIFRRGFDLNPSYF